MTEKIYFYHKMPLNFFFIGLIKWQCKQFTSGAGSWSVTGQKKQDPDPFQFHAPPEPCLRLYRCSWSRTGACEAKQNLNLFPSAQELHERQLDISCFYFGGLFFFCATPVWYLQRGSRPSSRFSKAQMVSSECI